MRPQEIIYSDTRKTYFDLTNGEVLVGREQRKEYLVSALEPTKVVDLGVLLRDPQRVGVNTELSYDRLDVSSWSSETYIAYTKWLAGIVEPPKTLAEKVIGRKIISRAASCGLGPTCYAVEREFDTVTALLKTVDLPRTQRQGRFDEWSLEDFVRHIREVGGELKPPTRGQLDERNRTHPNSPNKLYMHRRFADIGGFSTLVELAGYEVVSSWKPADFIDWGVRFMEANDGMLPTARMADFFSNKQRGPSKQGICGNFDKMSIFQRKVIKEYYERQAEREATEKEKLAAIEEGILEGSLPAGLFVTNDEQEIREDAAIITTEQLLEWFRGESDIAILLSRSDQKEIIMRFAKHQVLMVVAPGMRTETKITIAIGQTGGGSFAQLINKHHHIHAGDVEHEALVLGFFDDIWPTDDHLRNLKLDHEEYAAYKLFRDRNKRKNQDPALAAAA